MKYLYILLFFLIATQTSVAQFTLSNEKTFGGNSDDHITAKFEFNNTYYLFGNSNSPASGNKSDDSFGQQDIWLICTDLSYNILWDTIYGGAQFEQVFSVEKVDDGFNLFATSNSGVSGNKTTATFGESDIWYFKINYDGEILNQYSYGGSLSEEVYSGFTLNNNIYIISRSNSLISGNKTVANFGLFDYWIIKINPLNGQIIGQVGYGTSNSEQTVSMIPNSSENLVIVGSASGSDGNKQEVGFNSYDVWLLELDQNLSLLSEKVFGGVDTEFTNDVIEYNTTYYISSTSNSHISGNKTSPSFAFENGDPNWFLRKDIWVLKLDSDFNIIWDKTFGGGGREEGSSIFYADYDKLVFSCMSESNANGAGNKTTPNYGQEDLWVFITDLDGNILTQQNFGGTGEDYLGVYPGNSPTELFLSVYTNSTASATGNMSVVSNGGFDAWIADVDVQNWLTIAEENASKQIKVYPNPTENNVYFSETVERLEIRDAQGKVVQTLQNTNYTDLQQLPSGWYILEIKHNGKIERNKLVKR